MPSYIRIALCLFLLVSVIATASATTYYVSNTTGDDARSTALAQNPDTPWLTMQGADGNISDGDTVIVASGTYPEHDPVNKVFKPVKSADWVASGAVTIIKGASGSVTSPVYFSAAKTINMSGFIFDGVGSELYGIRTTAGTMNIDNCVFKNITQTAIYGTATGTITNSTFTGSQSNILMTETTASNLSVSYCNIDVTLSKALIDPVGGTTNDIRFSNNDIALHGVSTEAIFRGARATAGGTFLFTNNTVIFEKTTSHSIYFDTIVPRWTININKNNINQSDSTSTTYPIYIRNQTSPAIYQNNITHHGSGTAPIYITSGGVVTGPVNVSFNNITNLNTGGHGIAVGTDISSAGDNAFDGSIINGNNLWGIIYFNNSAASTVHGIFVAQNANVTISNNNVYGEGYGVVLKGTPSKYFSGGVFNNSFINCTGVAAIRLKGVNNLTISGNTVRSAFGNVSAFMITNNTGLTDYSENTSIKNNNVYYYSKDVMTIDDGSILGFSAVGDGYITTGGTPPSFVIGSNSYTFQQWQALGYDVAISGLGPTVFNWYCPAGRFCFGPFILWDPAQMVMAAS